MIGLVRNCAGMESLSTCSYEFLKEVSLFPEVSLGEVKDEKSNEILYVKS